MPRPGFNNLVGVVKAMLDAELQYRYALLRLTEITNDQDLAGAFRKRRAEFSDEIAEIEQCYGLLGLDFRPEDDQRILDDFDLAGGDGDFWETFTRR